MNRVKTTDRISSSWTVDSWKSFPAEQLPDWGDAKRLDKVHQELATYPPLVFAGEVRSLTRELSDVAQGKGFLLQGGDCAETFTDFTADHIRDKLKIILQMSAILTYGAGMRVVKVGRIAGQFAKPRSRVTETINGETYLAYRGDAVNDVALRKDVRVPNPKRMLRAYNQSAATLNLLRAFTQGGFADLKKIHVWNQEFIKRSRQGKRYETLANQIESAMEFMQACGVNPDNADQLRRTDFFTSHEGLLLGYEQALTRQDSLTGDWYDCSAHTLWIGDRTRQPDGAHVEFMSGIKNPLGIKLGPGITEDELLRLLDKLNPSNDWGRISLITRFGADQVDNKLPGFIRIIQREGKHVGWICDPMHGNTYQTASGRKTRAFDTILKEIEQFFIIHHAEGTIPGGVHFELTGDNVTECVGGAQEIDVPQLEKKYETACDPRLNNEQSLELAFHISDLLKIRNHRR